MKFHLTAIFTNLALIFGIMYLYTFVRESLDVMYFFRAGSNLDACFTHLVFVFSWASTFIIYKIKNQSTHFYYFLCFNILGLIIFSIFDYNSSNELNSRPFEIQGLFGNLKSAILETIIPILIISKCVSISQNIIGKKLLPARYC
jgi:hypothetical protein